MQILKDKKILLGVTGSIAAYKTLELTRLFIKAGANVKVIMSEEAKRFVTPLSFEAITKNTVLHNETQSWEDENNHIFINKWADIFVIAPATANTINKLSNGIADTLLTSIALAFTKPIVIAPAANTAMFLHPSTQDSLERLKNFGSAIILPQDKVLACDDKGIGALAEIKTIFFETVKILRSNSFWKNREIIVTGGGTIEKIDDVRFISNFSSGKMAESLALALFAKGALVTYIQSVDSHEPDLPVKRVFVKSSDEMAAALNETIVNLKHPTPFLFMAAAISDYKPKEIKNGKLKKEDLGESFNLKLIKTNDLLLNLDKSGIKSIGFKAEFDDKKAIDCAKYMLKTKSLDAVCLNVIDNQINPFGSNENTVTFITKTNAVELSKKSKLEISFEILKLCEEL